MVGIDYRPSLLVRLFSIAMLLATVLASSANAEEMRSRPHDRTAPDDRTHSRPTIGPLHLGLDIVNDLVRHREPPPKSPTVRAKHSRRDARRAEKRAKKDDSQDSRNGRKRPATPAPPPPPNNGTTDTPPPAAPPGEGPTAPPIPATTTPNPGTATTASSSDRCVCKSMKLLYPSSDANDEPRAALGPAANGSTGWPVDGDGYHNTDGRTLGPLSKHPVNKDKKPNQRDYGYAFEVLTQLTDDSNPDKCREIQLVKEQHQTKKGGPVLKKTWTGRTVDLTLDGNTTDVSSADKCAAKGGKWKDDGSGCEMNGGDNYAPDVQVTEPDKDDEEAKKPVAERLSHNAYEKEFMYKRHVGSKIIWYDIPYAPGSWVSKTADFVTIVRGTDGKACYLKFHLSIKVPQYEPKTKSFSPADEKLQLTGSSENPVDKVPLD